tara:strand:- start:1691 stop:1969 length:279 start_codon:yes stop_codon:yes gene_type:complete
MAFKMKNPFKQGFMPILTPRLSFGNTFTPNEGDQHKVLSAEELKLKAAKKACNENPNTSWKKGKCVKIVAENRIKTKSDSKSTPSTNSGNFA